MHTDGVTLFSRWPLQHPFDYIFSFDSIVSNLQYPRECQGELWIIVRGDGLPCGGESWCQMSISFANHGHLARTLSYHWTVNVALCAEKSASVLSQVWANNLAFLQSAHDSGVVPIRGASRRCRIFCGGDSPWLRRLSGVTTHLMAGSLFTYMTWCKSSATWLQRDVDRTTDRDEQCWASYSCWASYGWGHVRTHTPPGATAKTVHHFYFNKDPPSFINATDAGAMVKLYPEPHG